MVASYFMREKEILERLRILRDLAIQILKSYNFSNEIILRPHQWLSDSARKTVRWEAPGLIPGHAC